MIRWRMKGMMDRDVVGEGKTGKVNGYGGWRRGVLGGVAR